MPQIFVNRTLNLKKIKYVGLDMDHTLVRYNSEAFEALSFDMMKIKLVNNHDYPKEILNLNLDFNLPTRGLVIDRKLGNLLKISRHSAIRKVYHGTNPVNFKTLQRLYRAKYIDLGSSDYVSVDTAFSISHACMFALLVDFKDQHPNKHLPEYPDIADDVITVLDEAHRDNSIKGLVKESLEDFVIQDESVVKGLERFLQHGKKLFILTNSDYHYTKLLLDYTVNPFLQNGQTWEDIFEYTICFAQKPRFFHDNLKFLKINPKDGSMANHDGLLEPGVYQGGSANIFTQSLNVDSDDILYVGDHIYGDILKLKKACSWRTAIVIEELAREIKSNKKGNALSVKIEDLMELKEPMEIDLTEKISMKVENRNIDEKEISTLQKKISEIDTQISHLIKEQQALYNPYWGQVMRSGNEESYFASQVVRFACIYMAKLSDLLDQSPRTYFRASRRPMPHEV